MPRFSNAWLSLLRRGWRTCLAGAMALAAAACLVWFGDGLTLRQQVLGWGLVLVPVTFLAWQGMVQLSGPVFAYELIRTTRHGRHFWHRCFYAGFLLVILGAFYGSWFEGRDGGPGTVWSGSALRREQVPKFAESFFNRFMTAQFVAVLLLTPAYVAGAIAEEKEQRTLDFLLVTQLSNREIVVGKLVARLAGLSLVILAGLPIICLLQFLGGVDPNLVLAGFATTGLTMLSLGSLSILVSAHSFRPLSAVFGTYALVAVLAVVFACVPGLSLGTPFALLYALHPALKTNLSQASVLVEYLTGYAVVHGLIALGCCAWAAVVVRPVLRKPVDYLDRRAEYLPLRDQALRQVKPWPPRPRPAVGDDPMLWKEVRFEPYFGFQYVSNPFVGCFIFGTLALYVFCLFLVIVAGINHGKLGEAMNDLAAATGYVLICVVCILIGVRAAGSVSWEREKQTLDILLTTPLSRRQVLQAKWLGSVLSVRQIWWFLLAVWLLGALSGGLHIFVLPLLLLACGAYAAFAACLGLWLSTVCRTTQRASMWTLAVLLALGAVPEILSAAGNRSLSYWLPAPFVPWVHWIETAEWSPPSALWTLTTWELPGWTDQVRVALTGAVCYGLAALVLWALTNARFRGDRPPRSARFCRLRLGVPRTPP